jgi:hypothetical protein
MKMTFPTVLLTVFIVLKLTKTIAWSWLWVTCPLWIPLGLAALFFSVAFVIALATRRSRRAVRR